MRKLIELIAVCLVLSVGVANAQEASRHVTAKEPEKTSSVLSGQNKSNETYTLDGIYKGKSEQIEIKIEIKGNKWISNDPDTKNVVEMIFVRKNDYIYIRPYVPEGEKMIRNVVVVYKITRDSLASSHVEDVETGEKFYENNAQIVLIKQPNQASEAIAPQGGAQPQR